MSGQYCEMQWRGSHKIRTEKSIALAATRISLASVEKVNILFNQHYLFHIRGEVGAQKD